LQDNCCRFEPRAFCMCAEVTKSPERGDE
jgi:hypothetical protein